MVKQRSQRRFGRSGQSVVEYLVVAGTIIAVVVGIGAILKSRVESIRDKSIAKVDGSVTALNDLTVGAH